MTEPSEASPTVVSGKYSPVVGGDGLTVRLERVPGRGKRVVGAFNVVFVDLPGPFLVLAGAALLTPGNTEDIYTGAAFFVVGAFFVWMGFCRHFRKPQVVLTERELRSRGSFGLTHRADRTDIAAIDLQARTYGRSPLPTRVPYLQERDGSGFWLHALAGDANDRPIDPAQMSVLRQIRGLLNVGGSDG